MTGPLWLVGCGNLGRALLDGWLAAGLAPAQIMVVNPSPRALPKGVRLVARAEEAGPPPAIVVLAVKPRHLPEVAPELSPSVPGALVLSMLAGVRLATLARAFPACRVVRAMPNTPVAIRAGVTLLAEPPAGSRDRALVEAVMGAVGSVHWLDERLFDAASAVAGSGPAFLFAFIEALAEAGRRAGLERDLAEGLALRTVAGAAALAGGSAEPPAVLRERVTSPNGMTQAGLAVLEEGGALTTLLAGTIRAAAARSAELAQEGVDDGKS